MCGIWLSLGFKVDREAISIVKHRGPDGEGWIEKETSAGLVSIGHRRLAVVDTSSAGIQPMERRKLAITFNGEIYNYVELKAELEQGGHVFQTATDTEVLLAAYEQWGESCLSKFNGMFAFAIFDEVKQKIFVARDRFGVKPLYFWQGFCGIAVASEIKQILTLPEVKAKINRRRLYDFLATGLIDHTSDTMFDGIRQLRGGESLSIDFAHWQPGLDVSPHRWYELPKQGSLRISAPEAIKRFAEIFDDAIRLELRADVPIGSCLSGGLDSSSIVALANRRLRRIDAAASQSTFSAVYDDPRIDERRFIEAITQSTQTNAHYVTPEASGLAADMEKLAWHQDEPFGSTSIFAQWEVFRLAQKAGIKVMLDGQGADEQLGGYHSMFGTFHAGLLRKLQVFDLLRELVARRRRHNVPWLTILRSFAIASVPPSWLDTYLRVRRGSAAPEHLANNDWGLGGLYRSPVSEVLKANRMSSIKNLGDLCRAQIASTNLPALLHYEDRNSMAHGIEARVPFLDHRLVELTIALGDHHKIVDGETKYVLRAAMRDVLPKLVCDRQDKLGFPTPEQAWLSGPLADFLQVEIESVIARFPQFFQADSLRESASLMLAGKRPFDFWLWRVVSFGVWSRVFAVSA